MRRRITMTLVILSALVLAGGHEINQIEKDIDYVSDHSLNARPSDATALKDCVKSGTEAKKKAKFKKKKIRAKPRMLEPKEIYANADYVVKVRIFKMVRIPATDQIVPMDTYGFGSGSVVRCERYKYCVLTAFHVVDDSSMTYFAEWRSSTTLAQRLELIHGTTTNDSGILRFADPSYVPKSVVKLGNSDTLPAGTRVCALGSNAFGNFWISVGYTYHGVESPSGEYRRTLLRDSTYHDRLLSSSAQLYHGYSGGPLIDEYGRLVGINVSVTQLDWQVINNVIPINEIKKEFKILK